MLGIGGGQLARERSCLSHCKMEADCGGLFVKVDVVVVVFFVKVGVVVVVVVVAFLSILVLLLLWWPFC